MGYIAEHATGLRTTFFFAGIALFGLLGIARPYRSVDLKRETYRWVNNLSLTLLNGVTVYFLVPFSLVSLASNVSQSPSEIWKIGLQVVFLDMVIYCQHLLFHKIGFLWRLHRVHHSDTEFDSTTALRFHTLEIYISFFVKALAIWALGISPAAVVIFEIVLNFSAMFNHGNYSLWTPLEKLNFLVVTPDMHRIHHSIDDKERDSNYGFFLSIWDRVFRTYTANSKHDLKNGKVGTPFFREKRDQSLFRLIAQPFLKPVAVSSISAAPADLKKSS